jgi:hypothetical protein
MSSSIHVTKNSGAAAAYNSVLTADELMTLIGATSGLMTTVYAALAALPTADPLVTGAFWLSAGVVKKSAGA